MAGAGRPPVPFRGAAKGRFLSCTTKVVVIPARRTDQWHPQMALTAPLMNRRCLNSCAPEKRPCTPKESILTPEFGYPTTPLPKFPDRQGMENRVHFSYASEARTITD